MRASDPDASVTESTSLCLLPLWPSSSSATSTRSATSSPKSPTFWSEFIERVVALARRRSVFESGTRVNRSSSIFARASMRANSRFANALDVSPASPPSSSGASPSSCASSCRIGIGLCFSHGSESSRKVKGRAVSKTSPLSSNDEKKKKDCPALDWIVAHGVEGGTLPKIWYVRCVPREMVAFDLHGAARRRKRAEDRGS